MLYLIPIFLSAFLLFQVQPIIAKTILPMFGGGASVWTTCLLFFQSVLLLGYLYAHWLCKLKQLKWQFGIHGVLLLISALTLPFTQVDTVLLTTQSPQWQILTLLAIQIGLPYFTLSASSTLIQRWHSLNTSHTPETKSSYTLYSVSNTGSLLALVSYPFLVEPVLTLNTQGLVWAAGFIVLMLAFWVLFKGASNNKNTSDNTIDNTRQALEKETKTTTETPLQGVSYLTQGFWLLLSAVGVVALLATTNAMTQNVPPVPFLWILPLSLYLITFIVCFSSYKLYKAWFWVCALVLSALVAVIMHLIGSQFDLVSQVIIYSFILLAVCMVCHGELAKLQPDYKWLSKYYLLLAAGGCLGSIFVSIIAEAWFNDFLEFPLVGIAALVLYLAIYWSKKPEKSALVNTYSSSLPVTKLIVPALIVSIVGISVMLYQAQTQLGKFDVAKQRNFYGLLKVVDVDENNNPVRRLIDGTTSHGTQSLTAEQANIPKSYYRKNTGVALALEKLLPVGSPPEPLNVGLVGLGAGTLAAYGRPLEYYHFYELNPAVKEYAESYFSYLSSSKATVDISIGDGRQLLAQELNDIGSQNYDVMVIDAFSGDAIPMHLLTLEAVELYWQHMRPQGVLAIHISNSHLDLTALTRSLAKAVNKSAIYVETAATNDEPNKAQWVLITDNQQFLKSYSVKQFISEWSESSAQALIWTDDYSNLLSVLK